MITEHLQRPGTAELRFRTDFPLSASLQIAAWLPDGPWAGPGCHVVVCPTRIDPAAIGDAAALDQAIYSGRVEERPSRLSLAMVGPSAWLDTYIDTEISRTAGTPTQWLSDLLANGLTVGTVSGGSNVTKKFPAGVTTRRQALDAVAERGGWKYRVNPDFTVDAGTSLFVTDPKVVVTRYSEGPDDGLHGIAGGLLDQGVKVGAVATKALNLAGSEGAGIVIGTATKATSLKTPTGGTPTIVAVCSSPGDDPANAGSVASNFLNLQSTTRNVEVSSSTPMVRTLVAPGDAIYLWDPLTGMIDTSRQVNYRGELIQPMVATVLSMTWSTRGMGVFIRSNLGVWLDVSDWVEDEGDDAWFTVGDWAPANYGRVNRTSPEIEDRMMAGLGWTTYTPSTTNVTGAVLTGRYVMLGAKVGLCQVNLTTGTATAAGTISVSLPAGWTAAAGASGHATPVKALLRVGGVTGTTVSARVVASGTTMQVYASTAAANFAAAQDVGCALEVIVQLA